MTSKQKGVRDFFTKGKVFDFNMVEQGNNSRIEDSNNKFFSDIKKINPQQGKSTINKLNKDQISNLLPNFILNDIAKDNEEEVPTNKISNNNGTMNGQNFFFDDYDDDSENEDNQRLIVDTINNLENLCDNSNNFGNIAFSHNNNNHEVKSFFYMNFFDKLISKYSNFFL